MNQSSHPTLGVLFYSDQNAPLEIRRVMPGTPAEEAGLERGDEIISVDGRRVASVQQLRQQIDQIGTQEDIEFGVLRDGRQKTITARLTASQTSSSSGRGRNQPQWSEDQYGSNQGYQQQRGNQQQWGGQQYGGQQYSGQQYGGRQSGGQQYGYEQGSQQQRGRQQASNQRFSSDEEDYADQRGGQQYGGWEQGQGQAAHPEYDRGFHDGYAQAHHEMAMQGYGNQGAGGQSYMRSSRGAGNWQGDRQGSNSYTEGFRGSSGNHAFLGVTLDESDYNAARVGNIYPNSPAQEAGIRPGDEIVAIDDDDVHSADDLKHLLSQRDPNEEVSIEVNRNGRQRTLHATLTSQQQFMSSNSGSYRMGRRTNSGQQGQYGQQQGQSNDNRGSSRRQQNQNQSDEDDNY
jgi:hypothetical protein